MQGQHLVGAHPAGEAEELGQVPERRRAASEPAGAPETSTRPPRRPHEPAGDLDEGRLAGAVRAEQADELPRLDCEIDAGERLDPSVALLEAREHARTAATTRTLAAYLYLFDV